MSLRTRLIVAFCVLSVVPLAAVTFTWYSTSVRALRRAAEVETDLSTGELGQRMQRLTGIIADRVEALANTAAFDEDRAAADPAAPADPAAAAARPAIEVADTLGDAAMLLRNVQVRGLGRGGRGSAPPAATDAATDPGAAPERLVIDLATARRDMLREIVPEGQWETLTAEERMRVGREIGQRMRGIVEGIQMGAAELQKAAASAAPVAPQRTLSNRQLGVDVQRSGQVVGRVEAELDIPNMLATVFAVVRRDRGEVPFAVDADGRIHAPSEADRDLIARLGPVATPSGPPTARVGNWVVVTIENPAGAGLRFGIARPLTDSLAELRRTAVRNAAMGLGFIALALIGIVPLSSRLTRNLETLSEGVNRIAQGDYSARVPVRSTDEIGQLSNAFNQMAADVERHQRAAIEQERLEREVELGRLIQTEMLPKTPLRVGPAIASGLSVQARRVGGDFFNYFEITQGQLAVLIGDVSGKGIGAALLMANLQASLRARLSMGQALRDVVDLIDRDLGVNSPDAVYATLFVGVLDVTTLRLRYVSAGHPPQFIYRGSGRLERLDATGIPVGLLAGRGYTEGAAQLHAGDILCCYTDGCLDMEGESGDEMFGAERLEHLLASGASDVAGLLGKVDSALRAFRGSREPFDDATVMAVTIDPDRTFSPGTS